VKALESFYRRRKEAVWPVAGEDGRRLVVTLYVKYAVLTGQGGAEAKLPRSYSLELGDGSIVERVGDASSETFRIAETGETLRVQS
jgi:hypothetical protein